MPNSMFSLDASFPQFTGGESEKQKVGAIYDYLIQLQQTLRYCLQNLGGDNFNDTELEIIGNTIREPVYLRLTGVESEMSYISLEAGKISARMEDAEGNISQLQSDASGFGSRLEDAEGNISQLQSDASGFGSRLEDAEGNIAQLQADATGYSLSVTNGKSSATVSLKAGETVLSSQQIKLEGVVTFTAGEDGYSIIDGGRIYSEWIKTDYAWFTNDTEGIGHYINSMGMNFYKGKSSEAQLEVGSLYFHNDRLVLETRETSTLRISAAAAMEMMGMGDITIQSGGSINLKGNVFTNGERIVLERSPL